jgi:hypothetical protein
MLSTTVYAAESAQAAHFKGGGKERQAACERKVEWVRPRDPIIATVQLPSHWPTRQLGCTIPHHVHMTASTH